MMNYGIRVFSLMLFFSREVSSCLLIKLFSHVVLLFARRDIERFGLISAENEGDLRGNL